MAEPRDKDARLFYRVAMQRLEDARFLLEADRGLAAVYLSGYCVECLLKALILTRLPATNRKEMVKQFRGGKAHDYGWLREVYYKRDKAGFPPDVVQAFNEVAEWNTEWRYRPGTLEADEAIAFLDAVEVIRAWADRRMS